MKRNRRRTQILTIAWVWVSAIMVTKAVMAMQIGPLLERYQVRPDPAWLTLNSGLMLLLSLVALFSLRLHWRGSGIIQCGVALLIAADYWLERLLFWQPPSTANTLFALGLTIVLLGGVFWLTRGPDERK